MLRKLYLTQVKLRDLAITSLVLSQAKDELDECGSTAAGEVGAPCAHHVRQYNQALDLFKEAVKALEVGAPGTGEHSY